MFHICFYLALLCLSTGKVTGYIAYPNNAETLDSDNLKGLDFADLLLKRILEESNEQVDEQLKRNEKNTGSQECPDGWVGNDGSCYLFGPVDINFDSAKVFCHERGGHLVNVEDVEESSFLKYFMTTTATSSSYWLGMTDVVKEGTWEWIGQNGAKSLVYYFDWGPNEPSGGGEHCAWFEQIRNYRWSDVQCTRETKPLCEKEALKQRACAVGWVNFGSSCYYFDHELVTFVEANRRCQQRQGHPVQIESEAEWDFLKNQAEKISLEDFWIGRTDTSEESEWIRISSFEPVSFSKWDSGEPSNSGGEDCAHMGKERKYKWSDVDCTAHFKSYVCEI